ncbi:AraC family transcriptional regulator [Paenibacillus mucilaginosus]|uniref:AraC family transcriptional regulator n=1 Tax=Paenibacillus mucilaginosus (strain KNP414) TaxID=1036673 RepID=F8FB30_PAEMK|nr:helix-turn-helix domain-containing protein [Paenibacillus mucilaginosus]AEI41673.1 AraC family transcriptional regulator [Paenibacillus mucilaginosus KNP414]MCG7214370.1 AraC family transcriptional regulator [Paenibacillus mucilaginosus]WDM30657.1 AraC family transcriptional regulator [Paenibacillus mucilaginosus]
MSTIPLLEKEYQMRMNQVVRYIDEHLSSPLTAEELADVSAFSVYHFHRVFKRTMNENVLHFVNRLRVEKAAKLTVFQSERSLTDIALECGLQTPAHFARTFRRYTGLSATDYRARNGLDLLYMRFRETLMAGENGRARLRDLEKKYHRMKIEVKQLPVRRAACIHHRGTLVQGGINREIGEKFSRLEDWIRAHDLLDGSSQAIGLIFDDPCVTPASRQRYAVCFTTTRLIPPSLEVLPIETAGGKYAVLSLDEPADLLYELIHMANIHWLPLSPYQWDESRSMMAIFHGTPFQDPEDRVPIDFCIPVKLK